MESGISKFLRWAGRRPERVALTDSASRLTHRALHDRVLLLATQLRASGLQPGDFAAVACDRSLDGVVGILAVATAGAAYVPLDLSYPAARLAVMLEDARPRLLVATPSQQARLPASDLPVVSPRPTDGTPMPGALAVDDAAPAVLLFTSGSTGRPKGSVHSRRSLNHLINWHLAHPRLGQPARVLQFVRFGFDVASCDIFATLAAGGTLVLAADADRLDPFRLLALVCDEGIEQAYLPGAALRSLAQAHAASRRTPERLRTVLTAGEPLQVTPALRGLFAALPEDAELLNLYGPSECVYVTCRTLAGDPALWPDRPDIGAALPYVRLHVVDAALQPVPIGEPGELLIGSACMADGYLNRPEASAQRFIDWPTAGPDRERVYRSGDWVRQAADGTLAFIGREDEQIKVAGNRLELGEVETVLMAHPAVQLAVAVAPEGPAGRQLVAFVVPTPGSAPDAALERSVRAHMAAHLPAYACPARYVLRASLPLSANDKIDRRRLLDELPAAAPAESSSDRLLALWRELLADPNLQADDNVFEHGADSLRVMSFVTRLRELDLGTLAASRVYELTTPDQQGAALAGTAPPPLESAERATDGMRQRTVRQGLAALRSRNRRAQP